MFFIVLFYFEKRIPLMQSVAKRRVLFGNESNEFRIYFLKPDGWTPFAALAKQTSSEILMAKIDSCLYGGLFEVAEKRCLICNISFLDHALSYF